MKQDHLHVLWHTNPRLVHHMDDPVVEEVAYTCCGALEVATDVLDIIDSWSTRRLLLLQ